MDNDETITGAVGIISATEIKTDQDVLLNTMLRRLDINQSSIKIAEDNMTVWLYLMPPEADEGEYTKREIKDYLLNGGVITGYHESNISAMVQKRIYNREIIVAEGRPPIDGVDGYFEYTFDTSTEKAPKILEDGTVDYTSVNQICNVRAGDKLAVYHPARPGEDGTDVLGNTVKAKPSKELSPLRGTAISKRNTEDTYYAEKEGKIELRDGKLDIKSTHEVFGDVDYTMGKIEFFGDVIINGNVGSGVVIRAGRNIEIRGSVEAASLFAGGDIVMQRGIQGQQRSKASARGNVFAKFIEQTVVTAGGNVFADSIMNSRIIAENKVILSGKRGVLVGGYTHGLQGIEATAIGNEAETRTVVHAGCEAEAYYKAVNLKKQEVQVRRKLEALHQEINELKQKAAIYGDKYSQIMGAALTKMKPKEQEIREEFAMLAEEQQEIQEQMQKGKGAQVRVDGNIFRGTVVCIAQLQMPIENSTCYMNYTAQGGMIVGNVIVH